MILSLSLDPSAMRGLLGELQDLAGVPSRAIRRQFAECAPRVVALQRARCPVDDIDGGQLRNSIRFTLSNRGGRVQLTFIAGGEQLRAYVGARRYIAYPTVQEVDVTLKHRVGGAGYMSRPVAAEFPRVMARIVADVEEGVARGRA